MKIALVTDAWEPQVNGVVTTLRELCHHLAGLGGRDCHTIDIDPVIPRHPFSHA